MMQRTPPAGDFKGLASKATYRFDKFIAAGGEGSVFALDTVAPGRTGPLPANGRYAAKLYGCELTRPKIKKLTRMINLATPEVCAISAWPVDILANRKSKVVGFVMPLVSGGAPLHLLLTPKTRLKKMPKLSYEQLVRLAENLARAVANLHAANVVIGDINGQNFLVLGNGTVQAIDCDSMQIGTRKEWASGVGVEEYIAPELQGRSLKGVLRTAEHDNFALAVLIFELLMIGRHPFAGHADFAIGEAIRRRAHVFSRIRPKRTVFDITGLPRHAFMTPELAQLFERSFGSNGAGFLSSGANRPTANDWVGALQQYRRQLKPCAVNGNHAYPDSVKGCTWCALEKKKRTLFNQAPPRPARPAQAKRAAVQPTPKVKRAQTASPNAKPMQTTRAMPQIPLVVKVHAAASAHWAWRCAHLVFMTVFRIVAFMLKTALTLLTTPITTTWSNAVGLVRSFYLIPKTIAISVIDLIKAIAAAIWKAICVTVTVTFNLGLLLGALYLVLTFVQAYMHTY